LKLVQNAIWHPVIRASWALPLIAILILAPLPAHSSSAESTAENPSRQQAVPTLAGLRLVFRAVCGDVQISTDSANAVRYIERIDPRIRGSLPASSIIARKTAEGVTLIAPDSFVQDCSGLIYEIHVPHRYNLDISVKFGNLTTEAIDGSVALSTGGGGVRVGNVGNAEAGSPSGERIVARLQTAGGDVCVGNVGGGLRVDTAGGEISTGDVHGRAVLRTGGGDIHIGHVFGAARITTGGGDIVAQKIDGGIWADTGGGRVQIGGAAWLAALGPKLWPQPLEGFAGAGSRGAKAGESDQLENAFIDVNEFDRLFDDFVWGGVRVPAADQQKRLMTSVAPEYPDVARLAGIDGDVILRIFVARDGTVRDVTPLSGPAILARAAARAVEQWRYAPALVDGHPVGVVSTVRLAFRLNR
jgi:TonB family protein